jgi:hypothetical protein
MTNENGKPLSALIWYQVVEPEDIEEIEGKTTGELVTFLLRELSFIGLGLEEISARMAAAPRERRRIAPTNGRQIASAASLQMELF